MAKTTQTTTPQFSEEELKILALTFASACIETGKDVYIIPLTSCDGLKVYSHEIVYVKFERAHPVPHEWVFTEAHSVAGKA